jgi:cell division protein FtsA
VFTWTLGRSERICAVIDLGSHKINCAVISYVPGGGGPFRDNPQIEVHGFAAGPSSGWAAGQVRSLGAVVKSLRRTLSRAEAAAGVEIERAFLVSSFDTLVGEGFRAGLPLAGETASQSDLEAVFAAASDHAERGGRRALHVFATGYGVEANGGAAGPSYLTVDFKTLAIAAASQQNVLECCHRCQIHADATIAAPYASALAITTPEDRDLGICVIDLGGRTSSALWFESGALEHLALVPEGGLHITADIARMFSIPRAQAEHIKLCHGSVFDVVANDVLVPLSGREDREPLFKSQLNSVIRDRQKRILEGLKGRLIAAGFASGGPEPIVLTGGGSVLSGAIELAAQVFGRDVHLGQPAALKGLKADATLSALIGGCLYVVGEEWRARAGVLGRSGQKSSYADRIGQWLRAGF